MPTIQDEGHKKRRDPYNPRTGATGDDEEPSVPDDDTADLDDDQADSGPDRDHQVPRSR
jgi:hypothetical protein